MAKAKSGLEFGGSASVRRRSAMVGAEVGGRTVLRQGGVEFVAGCAYATRLGTVSDAEVYRIDEDEPAAAGPWLGEADKVAWRDEATGYECIMMRDRERGHLCGYVGVPAGHPLHGWQADAVTPDLGIDVHGGITYAETCDDGPSPTVCLEAEARRICHAAGPTRLGPVAHATEHRVGDPHAWWLGFSCDGVHDLVPGDPSHRRAHAGIGVDQVYRDDAYVVREVLSLAAQLRAIELGTPSPRRTVPPALGGRDVDGARRS